MKPQINLLCTWSETKLQISLMCPDKAIISGTNVRLKVLLLCTSRVILQDDRHALRRTFTLTFHSRFCKLRFKDERRPALRTTK